MAHRDINVAGKLTFVVYRGEELGSDPHLTSLLKIQPEDTYHWLIQPPQIQALASSVLSPNW